MAFLTDNSPYAWTLAAQNGASQVTSPSKFGRALRCSGTGGTATTGYGVTAPDSDIYEFGASATFTIECWAYFNSAQTNSALVNKWANSSNACWAFFITGGNLLYRFYDLPHTLHDTQAAWTPTPGQWYHLAVDRNTSGLIRLYVDGVVKASATFAQAHYSATNGVVAMGYVQDFANTLQLDGYLDEVRVSNVARYNGAFTPSSVAFISDANTLLLAQFDKEHYARQGASGANNGTDWTNAYTSIASVNSIAAGDVVWIASGTYSGAFIACSGTAGNPIIYRAATVANHGTSTGWANSYAVDVTGPATFSDGFNFDYAAPRNYITLDGQVRSSLSSGHGIRLNRGPYGGDYACIFAGGIANNLTIRYVDMGSPIDDGEHCDGIQGKGNNLLVEYCYIHECDNKGAFHGDGIQWTYGAGLVFRYCYFRHNGQHLYIGEDSAGSQNVAIYYNLFDNRATGSPGAAGWMINAGGPSSGPTSAWTIYNNTVDLAGLGIGDGYYFIYPANESALTFKNNAFYAAGMAEMAGCVHSFNAYDNASTGACTGIPTETGRVSVADLGFQAASSGDYRPTLSSSLRNAGTNVSLTTDIVGITVPATPDIGAFQYVVIATPVNLTKYIGYAVEGGALNAVTATKFDGYAVEGAALNAVTTTKFVAYAVTVPVVITGDPVQRYTVNT